MIRTLSLNNTSRYSLLTLNVTSQNVLSQYQPSPGGLAEHQEPRAHHKFANQAASSQTQGHCDDSFYVSVGLGQSIKSQARCWHVGICTSG